MTNPDGHFASVIQTSSTAYGSAYSLRRFAFLRKSDRNYLLQSATGVLMESLFFSLAQRLGCLQIIECGAHDAATSQKFVTLTSGRALAIEANPFVHSKYKEGFIGTSVDYRSIGLAETRAKMEINIPSHHTNESSLEASLKKRDDFKNYRSVYIDVDTLDTVAEDFVDSDPTCLWIDVEGLGGEVLEGARTVLNNPNLKLIYIEVQEEGTYYSEEHSAFEISEKLANFNFLPIARDYPASDLYNLLFVRSESYGACTTELSQFWIRYANLKVPFIRFRSPRDLAAVIKNSLMGSRKSMKPTPLDYLFSAIGSKSSSQRIADWKVSR